MKIPDPMLEQKAAARRVLRERREKLDPQSRTAGSATIRSNLFRLPQLASAGVIFCFVSNGSEVSTHEIIDQLLAKGKTVLVPKILRGEPMRAVIFRGWDSLVPGALGIPAPLETVAYPSRVDLVITPGLGFTSAGTRLGYGRGYYDRWFATHDHGVRVAIAFECQLEDDLPADATDIPVHILLTEKRTIVI